MGMSNGAEDAAGELEGGAKRAGERYAGEADKAINYAKEQQATGRQDIDKYYKEGQGYLDPYMQGGKTGLDAYVSGLGLGDKDAANKLYNDFRNSPGYQGGLHEGQKAVERSAAARGLTQSGALMKQLTRYGQDYADNQYGKFMDRLSGLAGMGAGASSQASNNAVGTGTNLAGLGQAYANMIGNYHTGVGQNYADSELAQANARAQGAMNKSNPWAGIGTAIGGIGGFMAGGPAGGAAGASAGKSLLGGG